MADEFSSIDPRVSELMMSNAEAFEDKAIEVQLEAFEDDEKLATSGKLFVVAACCCYSHDSKRLATASQSSKKGQTCERCRIAIG